MTRDEFDDWYDQHAAHFPGLLTWMGKFSKDRQAAISGVWHKHLATCELDDCLKATESLYAQGGRAPVYERHPQAIRSIVRKLELARIGEELEPRFVEGERVFGCLLCEDDGLVRCWHPKTVAAAADGTLGEPFTMYACTVACSCAAGDRVAKSIPRYSPERWAILGDGPCPLSQTRDECWALIEALREKRPAQPGEKQEVMF